MNPPPAPFSGESVNTAQWLALLATRDHRSLTVQICTFLESTAKVILVFHDANSRQQFDTLASHLLFVMTHPAYLVPDDLAARLISLNHAISSLVANSSFQTTDSHLEMLRHQPNNFVKILALYSARNRVRFEPAQIFQANPALASLWYIRFAELLYSGVSSEMQLENLRRHFHFTPPQLIPVTNLQDLYFGCTYVDSGMEKPLKSCVNRSIQQTLRLPGPIRNTPNPRKIALVSRHWNKSHSVYRIFAPAVRLLRPHYHLTLLSIANATPPDSSDFDEVRAIPSHNGIPDLRALLENDFQLLYYPDVGMCDESIYLTNVRVAPIQVASFGHPVSTHSSLIDYFLSGTDLESPNAPERFYSERLVLLPGTGCCHSAPPSAPPRPQATSRPSASSRLLINCPALGQKLNYPFLTTLARIVRQAARPVHIRFFVGRAATVGNDYVPLRSQFASLFALDSFEVVLPIATEHYLPKLAEASLAFDAFPFGGGNTIVDSLYLGIPIISREADRSFNRIGPAALRAAGFPELIVTSEDDYIRLACQLIQDDSLRDSLRRRILETNLDQSLFAPTDAGSLRNAFDHLIAHHQTIQRDPSRTPIHIPR